MRFPVQGNLVIQLVAGLQEHLACVVIMYVIPLLGTVTPMVVIKIHNLLCAVGNTLYHLKAVFNHKPLLRQKTL